MNLNFNSPEFRAKIAQNEKKILAQTSEGIQETEKFKSFHASLVSYLKESAWRSFKWILITKQELNDLSKDYYDDLKDVLDSDSCVTNDQIILNSKLEVISTEKKFLGNNAAESRSHYCSLSKKYIIFLLQPNSIIHFFIDEKDIGDAIFFREEDYDRFIEKRSLNKIEEVFEEYREHLKSQNTYCKFFAQKCLIRRWGEEKDFLENNKHILNNSPESAFRDDLLEFLISNLNVYNLNRETLLSDFKRLDIHFIDGSGYAEKHYFIEVKWVGESVKKNGELNGTSYKETDVFPEAIKQVIGYLRQLFNQKKQIICGYIVVFDARKTEEADTGKDLDKFSETLSKDDLMHYRKLKKIPDFRVVNTHPR